MDNATHKHYRKARHKGVAAQYALNIAQAAREVDELYRDADWDEDGYRWHRTDEDGRGYTVRADWEWDDYHGDDFELYHADAYSIEDRARDNNRAGMAKGVAWDKAREDWARDKEREDHWRWMVVTVTATDHETGATGYYALGGVDVLEWGNITRDALAAMVDDGMWETAVEDMRRAARLARYHAEMQTLPPMLRRPYLVA